MKKTIQPAPQWARNMYRGYNMLGVASRPGSLNILNKPSRIGQTLFYPNGTKEKQGE